MATWLENSKQLQLLRAALATLVVLAACSTPDAKNTPALPNMSTFEFFIDPQAQTVTPIEESEGQALQPQLLPSNTRILVPGVEIALTDLQFRFSSAENKVLIRAKLTNISESAFLQPFFFTLSEKSETANVVRALVPLVTDEQLGDGILSPGETTSWLPFELVYRDGPFSIFMDVSAVVEGECTDPVDIPDEALEDVIRFWVDKPTGDILCEYMERLTSLDGNNGSIKDLEGLQFAVNLTSLSLGHNAISDITPLQHLTSLTSLDIQSNLISNITPLQNLTNLMWLNVADNRIADIMPLQDLTNLTTLGLYENNISNINLLQNLNNLSWLSIFGNNVNDLTPLQNLTNLSNLYLNNNNISDISPLQNLTNLTELYLYDNNISDITALVNNTGIGQDDLVLLYSNPLDTCPSSGDRENIDTLIERGVQVGFDPCYRAALSPDNEVPPVVDSTAEGSVGLDLSGNVLSIADSYVTGLSSPLHEVSGSAAHIHDGCEGENGPILFPVEIYPDPYGNPDRFILSGSFELTTEQIERLNQGCLYINIHTENYPSGELRGQILYSSR